jgi:hypothetical protein
VYAGRRQVNPAVVKTHPQRDATTGRIALASLGHQREPLPERKPTMRKTIAALAGLTALAATSLAGATSAQAAPMRTESIVMTSVSLNGVDRPTRVVALGPIHGSGLETQVEQDTETGAIVHSIWHFAHGTVTSDAVENYSLDFDPTTCTARAIGTGTWTITGGTGAYAGARGHGTFTDRGVLVGARDGHGQCQGPDSNVPPRITVSILFGAGTAARS